MSRDTKRMMLAMTAGALIHEAVCASFENNPAGALAMTGFAVAIIMTLVWSPEKNNTKAL